MTKLAAGLPNGEGNGLAALARKLIDSPHEVHVVVALVDCKKVTTDNDSGEGDPHRQDRPPLRPRGGPPLSVRRPRRPQHRRDQRLVSEEPEPDDAPVEYGVRSWGPLVSGEVRGFGDRDAALAELRHRQGMWPTESHHLMHRRVSPWQRVGGPLPDLVAPPAPAPEVPSLVCLDEAEHAGPALSPDCRDGKCPACVGEAWDEHDEAVTDCTYPCHRGATP